MKRTRPWHRRRPTEILLRIVVPFGALALAFRYTQRASSERSGHEGTAPRPSA